MKRILALLVAACALAAFPLAATAKAPSKNIVQTAAGAGQFKTLVKLVKSAGLAGALSGKQKLTVFAPTDAAFAKVPKKTLTALGKDKAQLKKVLLYHVVKGEVKAAQVVKLKSAKTLEGFQYGIAAAHDPSPYRSSYALSRPVGIRAGVTMAFDRATGWARRSRS